MKLTWLNRDVLEITDIRDENGNKYYEVPYLANDRSNRRRK